MLKAMFCKPRASRRSWIFRTRSRCSSVIGQIPDY
jgi:hypothetical protein